MSRLLGPRQPPLAVCSPACLRGRGDPAPAAAVSPCKDTDPVVPGLYPHDSFSSRYLRAHLVSSKPRWGWGAGGRPHSGHRTGDARISPLCPSVGFLLPRPGSPARGPARGPPTGTMNTPCASLSLLSLLLPWMTSSTYILGGLCLPLPSCLHQKPQAPPTPHDFPQPSWPCSASWWWHPALPGAKVVSISVFPMASPSTPRSG